MQRLRLTVAVAAVAAAAFGAPAHATVNGTTGGPVGGAHAFASDGGYSIHGACDYEIWNGSTTYSAAVGTNYPASDPVPHTLISCTYYYPGFTNHVLVGDGYGSTTGYGPASDTAPNVAPPFKICITATVTWPAKQLIAQGCLGGVIVLGGDLPIGKAEVVIGHPLVAEAGDAPGHVRECEAAQCNGYLAHLAAVATTAPDVQAQVCFGDTVKTCVP